MPSERVIRFTHTFLFTLVLLASVVALGISGSLVGHYNSDGYPPFHTNAYRDRIRILLVASVWTTAWACKFVFSLVTEMTVPPPITERNENNYSDSDGWLPTSWPKPSLWSPHPPYPHCHFIHPLPYRCLVPYSFDRQG